MAGDDYGTAIELLPAAVELRPGEEEVRFVETAKAPQYLSVHAALSVPSNWEYIEAIANRENWRVLFCDRGPFEVIELWVENTWLLELLPPANASKEYGLNKTEFLGTGSRALPCSPSPRIRFY